MTRHALNRRDLLRMSGRAGMALAAGGGTIRTALAAQASTDAFRPGEIWLDTAGKPIHAHGGSILQVGSLYYWYGENKEKSSKGGAPIWHWGMRCYSSPDLCNWTDMGVFIPPVLDDPASPLAPGSMADRPHIIFNRSTGKFVCWIKIIHKDFTQTRAVFTADRITGPYTMVRAKLRPLGMDAGDFDLVVAPDGKAYMIFERVHTEMIVADLTEDYTNLSGYYSTHLAEDQPPFTREAPAYFYRKGKHYMFTSGTTGYHPNVTLAHVAETYHGPWTTLGDAHPSDKSRTSFNSQISSVFRHPRKQDLYIALADRWIYNLPELEGPSFATGDASKAFEGYYERSFYPGGQFRPGGLSRADARRRSEIESAIELSRARYVWLPVRFEGERPILDWREAWNLDAFD